MRKIIVDAISDTHNQHAKIICKGGDILIHSGDCTGRGSLKEALDFLNWFEKQSYDYLILVPGNHDWIFETDPTLMASECKARGIHLLNDSGITANLKNGESIKIWGSPITPFFNNWAFNRQSGSDIQKHWNLIPFNTEILITHGPPFSIGDQVIRTTNLGISVNQVGCPLLLQAILKTQVKLHICGHIHEGHGFQYDGNRTFVNVSSLDQKYQLRDVKPVRITRETFLNKSIGYVL